jgi:F-type H+-transporting ATPase subunit gamma
MANLKEIRNRIKSVKNTAKITSAMKMVSAAKLRRAQTAIESARPYVLKLNDVIGNLISGLGDNYSNELTEKRDTVNNAVFVVIGSDRGLCGSFNTNLFKEAYKHITETYLKENPNVNVKVITVGKKAGSFFSKTKLEVISKYPDVFTNLEFTTAQKIIEDVKSKYISGEYDRVFVYVNNFINVIKQEPSLNQILPIQTNENTDSKKSDYVFEPNEKSILDVLLPKLLNISVWRFLLESNAAEQAARMMAMDNATNNAKELVDKLNIVYNRERQAAITTEMLEIVGGANALENA